ncbi:hypothetical protein predicted by Glimmer/Critica [Sorangium cellulosum So ce56]|uniref:Uncharacterized protein n=1 Tax=Sorangium cellulosum (strain So ce56) TaxID=448385 RepID=A9GXC0_SORC5|nr:hypothetical protein predicted by Glimmer/Critica [Sorangium cellulosum So ce56]
MGYAAPGATYALPEREFFHPDSPARRGRAPVRRWRADGIRAPPRADGPAHRGAEAALARPRRRVRRRQHGHLFQRVAGEEERLAARLAAYEKQFGPLPGGGSG